ncbi:MAG: hypothetical protein LBL90_00215 [Prevotellaceae bacterium]|jgi:hypothetical protein|nr:hypothetical protein [Prevotellaceae bacterium]
MKQVIISLFLIFAPVYCIFAQPDITGESEQKISVLLGHRYSGGFNPHGYEQFDYTGLFKVGDSYFLKPTKIKVESSLDACSGDSIFTTKATAKGECLYLFWGLKQYTQNAIETHFIAPNRRFILPNKNYIFTFNKGNYSFLGEGTVNHKDNSIDNYRLILANETKNIKQVLVNEELLDNSKVEILFIGDLDGDGDPDFIINAPPHHDTRNILLFLSTHKENDKVLVHCVSQQFDWFDC